jgi:hypothetical protein
MPLRSVCVVRHFLKAFLSSTSTMRSAVCSYRHRAQRYYVWLLHCTMLLWCMRVKSRCSDVDSRSCREPAHYLLLILSLCMD